MGENLFYDDATVKPFSAALFRLLTVYYWLIFRHRTLVKMTCELSGVGNTLTRISTHWGRSYNILKLLDPLKLTPCTIAVFASLCFYPGYCWSKEKRRARISHYDYNRPGSEITRLCTNHQLKRKTNGF